MITKMSKYSFIVLNSELEDFLETIKSLGIVDITRSKKEIDSKSKEMMDLSKRYKKMIGLITKIPKLYEGIEPISTNFDPETLLDKMESTLQEEIELKEKIKTLNKEYSDSIKWGDFNPDDIEMVEKLGYDLHFFAINEKRYQKEWETEFPIKILNNYDGIIYFTILAPKGEELKFKAKEAQFPQRTSSLILEEQKEIENKLFQITGTIAGFTKYIGTINTLFNTLLEELDLYLANGASIKEGEGHIAVLEGFAPTNDDSKIAETLDSVDAIYLVQPAVENDNPPIVLKNNRFSRLFEPIGSLYVLPKYNELDLTPYFAPFYMLFFGFCLGDMGYGLVLVISGLIAALKVPKYSSYGKLVIFLGIGSIIMPLLSGTIFGMKLADIIPMPENIKELFFSDMKMFWFAIIFGLVQILFAKMLHAIDCFTRKQWDPALTNIGWCMVIIWAACAYAGSEMKTTFFPPIVNYILAIGGTTLILFFSKPSKHIWLRPLKGIVSLYDITGIFGDMLSYIRLFGLGTTGGILALVINSISMNLTGIPYVGWFFAIIMLIIGHIAVLGLSCLGAFVHPVRLTFVEFYKNAEFQGGGRPYNPLKSFK